MKGQLVSIFGSEITCFLLQLLNAVIVGDKNSKFHPMFNILFYKEVFSYKGIFPYFGLQKLFIVFIFPFATYLDLLLVSQLSTLLNTEVSSNSILDLLIFFL